MSKSVAVILAAGVGSRMGERTKSTSKCIIDLDGTTPLEHTILSFASKGIMDFIIVVGHHRNEVIDHLNNSNVIYKINSITYVVNEKYDFHGCEYSLSLASEQIEKFDIVYITEGDLLLHSGYLDSIVNSDHHSAVLARETYYIDVTRSVIILGNIYAENHDDIVKFDYDQSHTNVLNNILSEETLLGESIQLWKFSGDSKVLLTKHLYDYCTMASDSDSPQLHSGLLSINKTVEQIHMKPVYVDGSNWINLNTEADVEKAKSVEWILHQ